MDLTSPVAANQLASPKMATQDLTSLAAAIQLAAVFFFCENGRSQLGAWPHQGRPNIAFGGRDSGRLNSRIVSPQFHRSCKCIERGDIHIVLACTDQENRNSSSLACAPPSANFRHIACPCPCPSQVHLSFALVNCTSHVHLICTFHSHKSCSACIWHLTSSRLRQSFAPLIANSSLHL